MNARKEARTALREARMKQQQAEHDAMRARLRRTTDVTCAMLAELRVQHLGAGHFVNGNFVRGVGTRDAALALKPDSVPPKAAE